MWGKPAGQVRKARGRHHTRCLNSLCDVKFKICRYSLSFSCDRVAFALRSPPLTFRWSSECNLSSDVLVSAGSGWSLTCRTSFLTPSQAPQLPPNSFDSRFYGSKLHYTFLLWSGASLNTSHNDLMTGFHYLWTLKHPLLFETPKDWVSVVKKL